MEVPAVPAGSWVLLGGVDRSILKTATITSADTQASIFRPIKFDQVSVLVVQAATCSH